MFLTYSLPRTPSAPRLASWRKLRRLGVAQLAGGLAALPADARTGEQLEWAADEVLEAGGSAGVWLARPTSRAQERDVAKRCMPPGSRSTTRSSPRLGQPVTFPRWMGLGSSDGLVPIQRVERRDFFRPVQRQQARHALRMLGELATTEDRAVSGGRRRRGGAPLPGCISTAPRARG